MATNAIYSITLVLVINSNEHFERIITRAVDSDSDSVIFAGLGLGSDLDRVHRVRHSREYVQLCNFNFDFFVFLCKNSCIENYILLRNIFIVDTYKQLFNNTSKLTFCQNFIVTLKEIILLIVLN